MQATKKNSSVRTMVLIGILAALVFALSSLSIQIGDVSRIHFGNIMCLLSGVLFGPFVGGFAAGLGSMLYDFTNPLYTPEFWITFLTKFAMGFAAGFAYRLLPKKVPGVVRYAGAAFAGQALYVLLYFAKSLIMQHYIYGNPWQAAWPVVMGKVAISSLNGLVAVVACVVLAPALHKALSSAGLFIGRRGKAAG